MKHQETEIKQNPTFIKGEWVICIINSRASLTVGKEYQIIDVYESIKDEEITIVLKNDVEDVIWYDSMRFMPKTNFRNYIINEILK
jgi:hypothetical protein